MPNWVTNIITIKTKTPNDILQKYFTNEKFDFEKIFPSPTEKSACPTDCITNGHDSIQIEDDRPWFNWYKWNCKYWGTKWNSCNTSYKIKNNKIIIIFETAWAPPMPILKKLINQFNHNISIKCYEEWDELIFWKTFAN